MKHRNLVTTFLAWFAGVALVVIASPEVFAADQGGCNGAVECVSPYVCGSFYCCTATRWKGCTVQSLACPPSSCSQVNNTCNGDGSHTCNCGSAPQSPCRLCYKPSEDAGVPGTVTCINEHCNGPGEVCNTDWVIGYSPSPSGEYRYTCECQP
ncbi:MAG: hypothetical protein KDB73_15195 [Planctomycetes bacterium]|nr:hypothetical protein [Planctomycetota bacterium]